MLCGEITCENTPNRSFTTSAVDNIDHDPTATSAHGSFHRTGISLFQHRDNDNTGIEQKRTHLGRSGKTSHQVQVCRSPAGIGAVKKELPVPEVAGLIKSRCNMMADAVEEEYKWCDCVRKAINTYVEHQGEQELHVSWAAYHAKRNEPADVT